MNKHTIQKLFLILLPVMAVTLATTGDSVVVFDPSTQTTVYGSYFDLIPETGNYQILPVLAAVLAVAGVILAILYMVKRKHSLLKTMVWVAALSASAAALPIALRGAVTVVPNVMLPLLMCAQAVLAYIMGRKPQTEGSNAGRRLG